MRSARAICSAGRGCFRPTPGNSLRARCRRRVAIFFYGTILREYCERDPLLGFELMKRMSLIMNRRLQAARKQNALRCMRSWRRSRRSIIRYLGQKWRRPKQEAWTGECCLAEHSRGGEDSQPSRRWLKQRFTSRRGDREQGVDRRFAAFAHVSRLRIGFLKSNRACRLLCGRWSTGASRITGRKMKTPSARLLAENPATLSVCLEAHEAMIRQTGDAPYTMTCPFGLTETAVPVKLARQDDRISAHRPGAASLAATSRYRKSETLSGGKEFAFTPEVRSAWEHNPLFPPEKYGAIVRLLNFFAQQLSELSNQLMLERTTSNLRSSPKRAPTSTGTSRKRSRSPRSRTRRARACFISARSSAKPRA